MDETAIACIEEAMHLGLPLDVEAILLIETDGSDEDSRAAGDRSRSPKSAASAARAR